MHGQEISWDVGVYVCVCAYVHIHYKISVIKH